MEDDLAQKKPQIFCCKNCNFISSNKKDFNRHLSTGKHKRMTQELQQNDNLDDDISPKAPPPKIHYICECGSNYKYRQGLWKHKKFCKIQKTSNNDEDSEFKILTELVKEVIKQNIDVVKQNQDVMKQNQELTNKIVDICSNSNNVSNAISNLNNNSNNNNNNKTFNLQFFLNDTCKDAMNMSDFVNQVQVSISDLEETGELGYAEGISKIIIKNLNDIYYTDRPIHCSDSKRETLYIKEDDKWFKDDEANGKISKAIKQIAHKNIKQIPEWVKLHPDCTKSESKQNDKYLHIVSNSMSGGTDLEQKININKIISKVAKKVTIDKQITS